MARLGTAGPSSSAGTDGVQVPRNIIEQMEELKHWPDDRLTHEMGSPTGVAPSFLVLSELERRSGMRERYEAQAAEQPQSTVAQDVIAAAQSIPPPPQAPPGMGPPPGPPGMGPPPGPPGMPAGPPPGGPMPMGPPSGAPPGMRSGGPVRGYSGGSGDEPLPSLLKRRYYWGTGGNPYTRKPSSSLAQERMLEWKKALSIAANKDAPQEVREGARQRLVEMRSEDEDWVKAEERRSPSGKGWVTDPGTATRDNPRGNTMLPSHNRWGDEIDYSGNSVDYNAAFGPTGLRSRGLFDQSGDSSVRGRAKAAVARRDAAIDAAIREGYYSPPSEEGLSPYGLMRPAATIIPPVNIGADPRISGDPFRVRGVVPSPDAPATPPGGVTATLPTGPARKSDFDRFTGLMDQLDNRPRTERQLAIDREIEALRKPVSNRSAMFGAMAAAALKGGEHGFAGTLGRIMDARTPFLGAAEAQERENRVAVLGALGKQQEMRGRREDAALQTIIGMGDTERDDAFRKRELDQRKELALRRMKVNVEVAKMGREADAEYRALNRSVAETSARRKAIMDAATDEISGNLAYGEMSREEQEAFEVEAFARAKRNWSRITPLRVDPGGR